MSEATPLTQAHYWKTWEQAVGEPETSVWLKGLPAGLDFPEGFPEPIRYDAQRQRLIYRGFMTSVSYRFLHELHGDSAYIEALDYLFQASADTANGSGGRGSFLPWLVGAGALLCALALGWTRWH